VRVAQLWRGEEQRVNPGYWWLGIGIIGGLLPAYLIVRTVLHVLNINSSPRARRR
jgi:hypothetical protein